MGNKKLKKGEAPPSKADLSALSGRLWNEFYARHESSFFKDRHYQSSEFGCLTELAKERAGEPVTLCELGCGTGAALLPLMLEFPSLFVVGFDISVAAVKCLNKTLKETAEGEGETGEGERGAMTTARMMNERAAAFQGSILPPPDVVKAALAKDCSTERGDVLAPFAGHVMRACQPHLESLLLAAAAVTDGTTRRKRAREEPLFGRGFFDFSLLMFVLSALPFELHEFALREAALTLKPGTGRLLFRDYCVGDAAMARFQQKGGEADSRRIDEGLYVRGDGTLAAFLSPDKLVSTAAAAGLVVEELRIVRRSITNRGEGLSFDRCWLHCVFRRPAYCIDPAVEWMVLGKKIAKEAERRKEEARKEVGGENEAMTQMILMALRKMLS